MNCRVTTPPDRAARSHGPHLLVYSIETSHLGAFAQIAERYYITFIMSVFPSVCPRVSAALAPTLGGFSSNLILGSVAKICPELQI